MTVLKYNATVEAAVVAAFAAGKSGRDAAFAAGIAAQKLSDWINLGRRGDERFRTIAAAADEARARRYAPLDVEAAAAEPTPTALRLVPSEAEQAALRRLELARRGSPPALAQPAPPPAPSPRAIEARARRAAARAAAPPPAPKLRGPRDTRGTFDAATLADARTRAALGAAEVLDGKYARYPTVESWGELRRLLHTLGAVERDAAALQLLREVSDRARREGEYAEHTVHVAGERVGGSKGVDG